MKTLKTRITSAAFSAVLMVAAPLVAGTNRWTTRGPDGGNITALLSDRSSPAIVYAASDGSGVQKSEDNGASWRPVNFGLSDLYISSLIMRRGEPARLFAGTTSGKVFRTRDGGVNWTLVYQASPGGPIRSIALTRSSKVFATVGARVISSTDDGETWQESPTLTPLNNLVAVNDNLYGVLYGTLYVSTDSAATWTRVATGGMTAYSLAVDEDRSTLLIGSQNRVALSTDLGKTWLQLPAVPSALPLLDVLSLATFGGGWESSTGGVIVATSRGVFRIFSGATAWELIGGVLTDKPISLITTTDGNPDRVFAFRSDEADLYTWTAQQNSWARVATGVRTGSSQDVVVAGSSVYAATTRGISRLTDGAERWESIRVSSSNSPQTNSVLVTPSGDVFAGTASGLHKSSDGGATWQGVVPGNQYVTAMATAPSDARTMYAAMSSAMSKSTDGGETWFSIQKGMPVGYYFFYYGFSAQAIVVDPHDADVVYVCADKFYKSTDGGVHWTTPLGNTSLRSLAMDGADASILYGTTHTGSVMRSTDAGATWEEFVTPLRISVLVADPTRRSVLYGGSWDGRVYRSVNGGRRWALMMGLDTSYISKLAFDPSRNRLYAATSSGVYEYDSDESYLAAMPRQSVSLSTYYANFVSADDCGDGDVNAKASTAGPCETFTLYDVNGGTLNDGDPIYLQTASGSFVAAEGGDHPLDANHLVAASWEKFTIHMMGGDRISLQAHNGDYVAAEGGGGSVLTANRKAAREWETFTLIVH